MNAQMTWTACELTCPRCTQTVPSPNGSLFWTRDEVPAHAVICGNCGVVLTLPKVAK